MLTDNITDSVTSVLIERLLNEQVHEFTHHIRLCMAQEHVNLEAAIVMHRQFVQGEGRAAVASDLGDEFEQEVFDKLLEKTLTTAEEIVRGMLAEAVKLVELDRAGASEPKPRDQWMDSGEG